MGFHWGLWGKLKKMILLMFYIWQCLQNDGCSFREHCAPWAYPTLYARSSLDLMDKNKQSLNAPT